MGLWRSTVYHTQCSQYPESVIKPALFKLDRKWTARRTNNAQSETIRLAGKTYPAIYSYGISVDASKRRLGYGTLIADQRLRYGLSKMGEKGLFYGYIEATNISSLKTNTKVGSEPIGQYHVLVISRLRPMDNAHFQNLKATRRDQLVQLLNNQYENHALVDLDQSVETENYYILEQKGEIVAGLQCERHQLTISHLSGAAGQTIVNLLAHIPVLRRLFPERNLHFLRFGNIYVKKGMEAEIFNLMEALLARYQLNFGLIYMDKRSPVYRQLKAAGKLGVFHTLIDVPVYVMAFFKGFSESEVADIRTQALFISMMDPV